MLFPRKSSPIDSSHQNSSPGLKILEGDTPTNNQLSAMNKFPWVVSPSGQKPRQEVVKEPLTEISVVRLSDLMGDISALPHHWKHDTNLPAKSFKSHRRKTLIYTHTTLITIYRSGKSAAQSCWGLQSLFWK